MRLSASNTDIKKIKPLIPRPWWGQKSGLGRLLAGSNFKKRRVTHVFGRYTSAMCVLCVYSYEY
jgi:hypothetical protein